MGRLRRAHLEEPVCGPPGVLVRANRGGIAKIVDRSAALDEALEMNRLARETSPYLLQHAENPVDWHPWGDEAFERARAGGKPVFLSIGYSTCHWCHVMAHESFEDPAVAEVLNRDFVSIKVDREERPDVDRIYMAFVQATTGGGGWPMSVWLTPEGEPFYGGTYFPPRPMYGRPSFVQILERIAEVWRADREKVKESARKAAEGLRAASVQTGEASLPGGQRDRIALRAFQQLQSAYDEELGGFGGSPKFPQPALLEFLLDHAAAERGTAKAESEYALRMALETLARMANGGIYDHLGGGFHRYSVDRHWHVPHFEKMLYDQGQLAGLYLSAFQITGAMEFRDAAEGIFDYVMRDLLHAEGGFFSAEDADSEKPGQPGSHGEGAFYVWSAAEIREVLGGNADLFCAAFGVAESGNTRDGSDPHGELTGLNVLERVKDLPTLAAEFSLTQDEAEERLADAMAKLFAIRANRPRPGRDEKILTAWNGLMISAFTKGGILLEREDLLRAARQAAQFIWERMRGGSPQGLVRAWRDGTSSAKGFADDYANYIRALLDLFEAGAGGEWFVRAAQLQETMEARFANPDGGWFLTPSDGETLITRPTDDHDGAEPSATSIAVENLIRLAHLREESRWLETARKAVARSASTLAGSSLSFPLLLKNWRLLEQPAISVTLSGRPDDPLAIRLLRECHRHFIPGLRVLPLWQMPEGNPHALRVGAGDSSHTAKAWICRDFACGLPVASVEALGEQLRALALEHGG